MSRSGRRVHCGRHPTALLAVLLLAAVSCVFLWSVTGCADTPRKRSRTSLDYFDTVCSLIGYAAAGDDFNRAADGVFDLLKVWHERLDVFEEYDGMNNLCTLNRCAGEPVALDDETLAFLEWTLSLCEETGGQVNPVMGSVTLLWKECAVAGEIPAPEELRSAAEHIAPDSLVIDRAAGTATLTDPDARVDVGAFGKGYVADVAADWLTENGYDHFAIDLGGNVRLVGEKVPGKPWTVGVEDPRGSGEYLRRLSLSSGALATSGSYQRYFEVGGVRYHHIIDPDTLMPENPYLSVSVCAPDAATADALSTALFNMTEEEGRALVARMSGVSVLWVYEDREERQGDLF